MKSLLVAIFLIIVFTGCASEKTEEVKEANEALPLRVGIDPTFPPFETIDSATGAYSGFDIELIDEICSINNWEYELIPTPFENLLNDLRMNKFDMVISAVTITEEREVDLLFSTPYYQTGQILAVLKTDSTTQGYDDLTGLRVGVQLGTTGENLAKKIDGAQVFSFSTIDSAFLELSIGALDAVLNDHSSTLNEIAPYDNIKLIEELASAESYGIAFNKKAGEFQKEVNHTLEQIKAGDRYRQMIDKWFDHRHQLKSIVSDTI